jgi:integrase
MNYRYFGRRKTLAFWVRRDVGLAGVRAKRDAACKLRANGRDPSEQHKLDKIAASMAAANTFRAVAEEWYVKAETEGLAPATLNKIRGLLHFAYPYLGNRPIAEILRHEYLSFLRKFEAKGRHESAKRLRSTCGQVVHYAVATARAGRDISTSLRGALASVKVTHRAAITRPVEVGWLLRVIDGNEGHPITLAALKLLLHVVVRPRELRHAEGNEFDLDNAVWTIPARKTKMRREHRVPLSRQALLIIASIETDTRLTPLVFPSLRSAKRPMSENTINAALRRLGYAQDEMTAHGFRAMASTLLNEMGTCA